MHARIRKIRIHRRWRRLLSLRSLRRNDRGVQLVELAIVLPLFMILFGATAEFGRYFYEYSTLAKATRVGTRYLTNAAVNTAEDTKAKNLVVYGTMDGTGSPIISGLTTANITITRSGGVISLPQTVTVQVVNFKYEPMLNLGALTNNSTFSLNIDIKPSVTMRYLLTQPAI
ncbi:MAG TPA: TadE/TadG family type IV pilus assembly protein [Pyrinomonadaceae bacterium]|nr:TadE/TadG family type IV pilus assembly protein [Pyrinomonadaceae bacterium]